MANVRQTNFANGEIAPALHGRTDLPAFARGLRRCRDFFISRQGSAVSRPGTTLVQEVRERIGTGIAGPVRLIQFTFSDSVSYCLEFGHRYIRFHTDGGTVLDTVNKRLGFVTRVTNFTVGETVTGGTSGATGVVAKQQDESATAGFLWLTSVTGTFVDAEALTGSISGSATCWGTQAVNAPYEVETAYDQEDLRNVRFVQSGNVLTLVCPDHPPRELTRTAATNWAIADIDFRRPGFPGDVVVALPLPVATVPEPEREWAWKVTELRRDSRGIVTESAPFDVTEDDAGNPLPTAVPCYQDLPVLLTITPDVSPPTTDPNFIGFIVYRGRAGLFGLVGHTDTTQFTDIGDVPDYARAPPQGRHPFNIYDASGSLVRTEYPTSVAYFEERRVFGGTAERPGFLFFSATGDYANFDERLVPVADEALMYELASRRREEIRNIVGLNKLVALTNSSAWTFGGSGGDPIAPDVLPDAKAQADVGATVLPPLVVDGTVLFARNKGVGVHGLVYDQRREGMTGGNLSALAQHLFTLDADFDPFAGFDSSGNPQSFRGVIDWTYAEDPWGVIWAARSDGKLLSLTYSQSDDVLAWALHDTGRSDPDDEDSHDNIESVCSIPEGDEDYVYVSVLRRVTVSGVPASTRYIERMATRMEHPDAPTSDAICVDSALRYSGAPALTLTGLTHLEGRSVYVIGKSNGPQGPFTVVGGSITLDELPTANSGSNVVLYVGLLYQPELETLDAAPSSSKQKTVTAVVFEVQGTRGFSAGQDFEHLDEWRQRETSDGYGIPSAATAAVRVGITGTWNIGARAVLRQTEPLPVTVLGITREVDVGG